MNNNSASMELSNYSFFLSAFFDFDANPNMIETLRSIILKYSDEFEINYFKKTWEQEFDCNDPRMLAYDNQFIVNENNLEAFISEMNEALKMVKGAVELTACGIWYNVEQRIAKKIRTAGRSFFLEDVPYQDCFDDGDWYDDPEKLF